MPGFGATRPLLCVPGRGLLSDQLAGAQSRRRERVFVPPKLPSAALPVAAPQDRNFSPPTILSMILRSACNPSPTRASPAVAVAATLARLSASLVVLNRGSV